VDGQSLALYPANLNAKTSAGQKPNAPRVKNLRGEQAVTPTLVAEHPGTCCTFWRSVAGDTHEPMERKTRRSRMRRTRTGKRLELTARDFEIFRLLHHYRYLRSTYIHAFVGGASATRFKERLGDLFHEGYIDRPSQQWELANARCRPAVYESGGGSFQTPAAYDAGSDDAVTFLAGTAHRQFLHSLMICEIMASLDIAIRSDPCLRFIAWPEILRRAPQTTRASPTPFRIPVPSGGYVVPDGLFGIEYSHAGAKTYRFFALEADRGTMPVARSNSNQTSFLGKLGAYRQIMEHHAHKKHWGIPNLLVLTLTVGDARLLEMLKRLDVERRSSATFLFKAIRDDASQQPGPQLLTEPWQRAGFPPMYIDK
jgi:hypothetical protein